MKKLLPFSMIICFSFFFINVMSQPTLTNEIKTIGGKGNDFLNQMIYSKGKYIIIGSFQDTLNLGGTQLISEGFFDGYIASFDSLGNFKWGKQTGGKYDDNISSVVADSKGSLYVVGYFQKKFNVGGQSLASNLYLTNFVAKFSSSGKLKWLKKLDKRNKLSGCRLTKDTLDNLFFTGNFQDTLFILNQQIVSKGKEDIFLLKFDTMGSVNWLKSFGGEQSDIVNCIKINSQQFIYLGGSFEGSILYNNRTITAKGGKDLLLLRFNQNGAITNFKHSGDVNNEEITSMEFGNDNHLFLTGNFEKETAIGSDSLKSTGFRDVFLLRLNQDGNVAWINQIGGTSNDNASVVALNQQNDVFLSGTYKLNCLFKDCQTGLVFDSLENKSGNSNVFIAKYSAAGKLDYIDDIKSSSEALCNSLIPFDDNLLILGGTFRKNIVFSGGSGESPVSSHGGKDIFILALASQCQGIMVNLGNDTVISNMEPFLLDAGEGFIRYTWQDTIEGNRYFEVSETGDYWVLAEDQNGCQAYDTISVEYYYPQAGLLSNNLPIVQENSIKALPNPTNDNVLITIDGDINQPYRLELRSYLGPVIQSIDNIEGSKYSLDLSPYPPGCYILTIYLEQKHVIKIIKI